MTLYRRVKSALSFVFRPKAAVWNAASTGRRLLGWVSTRLGINTLNASNLEKVRERSREVVRNSPVASAAIDRLESNLVGTGIVPHFNFPDKKVKDALNRKWTRWASSVDFTGNRLSFAGFQSLAVREIVEAGEVFCHLRTTEKGLRLQLIPGEQVPSEGMSFTSREAKSGVVFNDDDQITGYQVYRGHPYDTMFAPADALQTVFIPAEDMLHAFKQIRAGQIRGIPKFSPVLMMLHELEEYSMAERERKKVSSMYVGFVEPASNDGGSMFGQETATQNRTTGIEEPVNLQPGSFQQLRAGEKVTFSSPPESVGYSDYMKQELRSVATAMGITYEQLGDLSGVNYSSIRAGLIEFYRSAESFQYAVLVDGVCKPVMSRWLKELAFKDQSKPTSERILPDEYYTDTEEFESFIEWTTPGWSWVDPLKEVTAKIAAIRAGLLSKTMAIREMGYDPDVIFSQIKEERLLAEAAGVVFDSDAKQVDKTGSTNLPLPDPSKDMDEDD